MKVLWRYGLSSLLSALALSSASFAGAYNGVGHYVVVYSSYAVSGSMATGFKSVTYYGPIKGPFETDESCKQQLNIVEQEFRSRPKRVGDGTALFMCYFMEKPMQDDSGDWWNPRRDD